ncbi:MAG: esterase [Burkholderiales bacterium]|nr:esterase [Burkholderiales bacterium]
MEPATHLIYLHGFRSSPASAKARRLAAWVAAERPDLQWLCPELPPSPRAAMDLVRAATADWPAATSAVVGSSLGGYYATLLAQERGWRGAVINPAVEPARDLAAAVGEQTGWHDPQRRFAFTSAHLAELRALGRPPIGHPERLLAVVAKGDELLDWREMTSRYAGCALRLVEGSDHGLSDFDDHLPALIDFLGLRRQSGPCMHSSTTPGSSTPAA